MEYAETHKLETEEEYSYQGTDQTCKNDLKKGSVSVKQVNYVTPFNSWTLKSAIAVGPVSVTVEADTSVFQGYTGGVLNSKECGVMLDHAITAVGFGKTEEGQEYYIVRNSWGPDWGDKGYINIATQTLGFGICGIQRTSVWPDTN